MRFSRKFLVALFTGECFLLRMNAKMLNQIRGSRKYFLADFTNDRHFLCINMEGHNVCTAKLTNEFYVMNAKVQSEMRISKIMLQFITEINK